jgi:propionyl-CoA carboxylase alpha chain
MESRLYAEDPYRNFLPSIGRLTTARLGGPPAGKWQGDADGETAVRNDTGVFEGGEISMYLRPDDRQALHLGRRTGRRRSRRCAIALDRFEVEGIGHNLPFLSAVMDHPKFVSGDITTAFIAEEYPEGFDGVTLSEAMRGAWRRRRRRCTGWPRSGARGFGPDGQPRARVGSDWVVSLQGPSTRCISTPTRRLDRDVSPTAPRCA